MQYVTILDHVITALDCIWNKLVLNWNQVDFWGPFSAWVILNSPFVLVWQSNNDGLMQNCSISSALAIKILQSFLKPSIWLLTFPDFLQTLDTMRATWHTPSFCLCHLPHLVAVVWRSASWLGLRVLSGGPWFWSGETWRRLAGGWTRDCSSEPTNTWQGQQKWGETKCWAVGHFWLGDCFVFDKSRLRAPSDYRGSFCVNAQPMRDDVTM